MDILFHVAQLADVCIGHDGTLGSASHLVFLLLNQRTILDVAVNAMILTVCHDLMGAGIVELLVLFVFRNDLVVM